MSRTRILKPNERNLAQAASLLRRGGLVAFPTETVYGLGARAYDASAARRVYKVKGRPSSNPLIVHIADEAMLSLVARKITPLARKLIDAFWPGPLTLILDKTARIPSAVTAGGRTVAVRCPGHPAARALIRALGEPIAAPSANLSGRPSPTTAAHVLLDLKGRIELILDGGPCRKGLESAIVDARGKLPVVLRHGTLTAELISRVAGAPLRAPGGTAPAAPGTKHRHYAPSCRVILVPPAMVRRGALAGLADSGAGLVHRAPRSGRRLAFVRRIPGGATAYAAALFSALRDAEAAGVTTLYVETVPDVGVGRAVMDRLRRAARR
ncbi:MAG: threonylcarbamoyl-AMP synthase [Elusimicrobia bacterium CG11_big_fil_rev_8_21_14_0_20_64_6]|nr:MAG: threonylcarbamoyl-AMP synthase [Elusimicrobia bacterium CG11_big_fil_rev_8_21_14_0_20_64_6]